MRPFKVKLSKGKTVIHTDVVEAKSSARAAEAVKRLYLAKNPNVEFTEIIVTDLIRRNKED